MLAVLILQQSRKIELPVSCQMFVLFVQLLFSFCSMCDMTPRAL